MPDAGVAADVVSPVAPDLGAIEERASLATEERAAQALKADVAPPADVLDSSTRQKLGVLTLLRVDRDGWSGEDWRAFFDERAGIADSTPRRRSRNGKR
jgi:hypothetical protein